MWVLGSEEWSIRLFDLILCLVGILLMIVLLQKLYGDHCALLSCLLYAVLPISAYFGCCMWMAVLSLWALYRYLELIGRLGQTHRLKVRHLLELALALFLMIQLDWVGVFYAAALGLHFVASSLIRWGVQGRVLTGEGSHTLYWRYYKDGSASAGQDCGWLDCLSFTPTS